MELIFLFDLEAHPVYEGAGILEERKKTLAALLEI